MATIEEKKSFVLYFTKTEGCLLYELLDGLYDEMEPGSPIDLLVDNLINELKYYEMEA